MKIVFRVIAFFCFALGIFGAFIPVLPTVPFLAAASFLFAKGSDRYYKWFTSTNLYKMHLRDYVLSKTMTLRTTLTIVIPVCLIIILLIILIDNLELRIIMCLVILTKNVYFWRFIKTNSNK